MVSMCGDALVRITKKILPCLQSSMGVVASCCMTTASNGELRFIEENMDSNILWHSEAEDDALPSETVFQHNYPKHTTKMTTALLLKVKVMEWPSMSPDLNPIEHMWGILKWKVEKNHVSNIQQLRDVFMEEWKRMPATTCAALVNSIGHGSRLYIGLRHDMLAFLCSFMLFYVKILLL